MSDIVGRPGPAEFLERIRVSSGFRSHAALTARTGVSLVLPVATGFFGRTITTATGIHPVACTLFAVALASLAAPAIPAFRDEVRQFDVAGGVLSVVVGSKLLQIVATAARAETIDALDVGFVTLAVAAGIGIVRGFKVLRRPNRGVHG